MRRRHSQLSKQILMQYILSVLGMIASLALLFFIGWVVCRLFIWEAYDPLYRFLKTMQDTVAIWGTTLIILGMFLLAYRFISKPLEYLDEALVERQDIGYEIIGD